MAEHNFSVENTLTLLLDDKKYHSLRDILSTMNPADIAAVFDELPESRLPLLFRLLPKELAAETFVEMDTDAQALLIRGFSDSELKEVIDELYVDDAVDIVEEMPANVVQRILTQADPEMRKQINEILRYPEDSAGSIMTTEYVSLRPNMTVGEAILRIRRTGIDKETIYTCYVTKGHKLIGLVSVKDLLLCEDDNATIESIMTDHVITVGTLDDQEQVAQMFSKYDFLALPVVDTENRLGRHRHLRRRHGRHGGRGDGGYGKDGRLCSRPSMPYLRSSHVRNLEEPHSLADAADDFGNADRSGHYTALKTRWACCHA